MIHTRRNRTRAGFTLMEVLLVLVILVILGSFAVTTFTGVRRKANADAARAQISLVESASRLYFQHMNNYPTSIEDLVQAPSDANEAKWGGPYLERQPPLDPWGNPYQYVAPGSRNPDRFDTWSFGPDGVDGTDDDIGNWDA